MHPAVWETRSIQVSNEMFQCKCPCFAAAGWPGGGEIPWKWCSVENWLHKMKRRNELVKHKASFCGSRSSFPVGLGIALQLAGDHAARRLSIAECTSASLAIVIEKSVREDAHGIEGIRPPRGDRGCRKRTAGVSAKYGGAYNGGYDTRRALPAGSRRKARGTFTPGEAPRGRRCVSRGPSAAMCGCICREWK